LLKKQQDIQKKLESNLIKQVIQEQRAIAANPPVETEEESEEEPAKSEMIDPDNEGVSIFDPKTRQKFRESLKSQMKSGAS